MYMISQMTHLEWCDWFRDKPYMWKDDGHACITLGRLVPFLLFRYPLDPTISSLLYLSVLVRSMDILI
jgi:hypothetical protein